MFVIEYGLGSIITFLGATFLGSITITSLGVFIYFYIYQSIHAADLFRS
jgi:hypothetical protein